MKEGRLIITEEKIEPQKLVSLVGREAAGAIVTFFGVVRRFTNGKEISSIEYEVYQEMADKVLGEIEERVKEEFPDAVVAIYHRYGHLMVGEVSLGIASSSPHSASAFGAVKLALTQVKQILPVWKREIGPGGSYWVSIGA